MAVKAVHRMRGNKINALLGVIASRAQLAASVGKTFDGARDTYAVLGYPRILTYQDFYEMYQRQDVAGRIVTAPPMATWASMPLLETGTKTLNKTWEELEKRLHILATLTRADKIAGIGQFGILVIGVNDGRKLEEPMRTDLRSPKDLLYLTPYSENSVTVDSLVMDGSNPRFGKPEMYSITQMKELQTATALPIRVHHSRVIHIAEGMLENELYGEPRLRGVFNRLLDLEKVVGGSAEYFWRIADRGIQFDLDPDVEMDPDDEADMEEQIEDYVNHGKRIFQTRGVTAKVLGSETSDPRGSFTSIIGLISGRTRIPQRVLLGAERGEMASSQDKASWGEVIIERRILYAEPIILRPLIDLLMRVGILRQTDYKVVWAEQAPQSKEEQSQIANRISAAAVNISKQLEGPRPVISAEEFRESIGLKGPPPKGMPRQVTGTPNPSRGKGPSEDVTPKTDPEKGQSVNK